MAALLNPELAAYIPRYIQIESGGDPNARTGSYTGLLQMGPDEIKKYGGNGLEQGTQLLADRAAELEKTLGRPPTPTELYLAHQQGMGGVQAHMANPDAPAWQNMYSTGEGQQKGEAWAKKAIWGNVPDDIKRQFPGGVNSVTSQNFMDIWRAKVERSPMPPYTQARQASLPPAQQPISGPAPLTTGQPLPPQPLNLAGLATPQQLAFAPPTMAAPQALQPMPTPPPLNAPAPIQQFELARKVQLARALQNIPLPPGFRGVNYG